MVNLCIPDRLWQQNSLVNKFDRFETDMSSKAHQTAIRATLLSISGSLVLALVKLIAGIIGNSYALIADAIESATDVFSSFLVLVGIKFSSLPPDEDHPYGHGRIETLVTILVVGFLLFSASLIAYQSIHNISEPQTVPHPFTLLILGGIIIWKELSFRWVLQKSNETHSSSLKADAWHHRSDAITSVAAFIGILIAVLGGEQYAAADDYAALMASGFIFYNSWLILRPALGEIMDEHRHDDLVELIRLESAKVDGVAETEKCMVRKMGMKYYADLHAVVNGELTVREGHEIAHRLKDHLMNNISRLGDVQIHIEPSDLPD
jgi:cation diffusion facilitator family transporter